MWGHLFDKKASFYNLPPRLVLIAEFSPLSRKSLYLAQKQLVSYFPRKVKFPIFSSLMILAFWTLYFDFLILALSDVPLVSPVIILLKILHINCLHANIF